MTIEKNDCTFRMDNGYFSYRVGAIIKCGDKLLLARHNEEKAAYYPIGGRIRYGETAEEAAVREVREETGVNCKVERLLAIHENFFISGKGEWYHEINPIYLIAASDAFSNIPSGRLTDDPGKHEWLEWVDMNDCADKIIYPYFLRDKELFESENPRYVTTRGWDWQHCPVRPQTIAV